MRTRMLTIIAIAAAIVSATALRAQAPAGQQAPPPSKAVVIRGQAPVSEEVLRVKLPRPQEATLSNGLRLMVLEDRRVPRITMQLIIPGAGGYYDPADLPGLASVTSAMMREGTTTRSSSQLSEQLETLSATLDGAAPGGVLDRGLGMAWVPDGARGQAVRHVRGRSAQSGLFGRGADALQATHACRSESAAINCSFLAQRCLPR